MYKTHSRIGKTYLNTTVKTRVGYQSDDGAITTVLALIFILGVATISSIALGF